MVDSRLDRWGVTEWADYYLRARATDADALAGFAPRDGRGHSQ